MSDVVIRQPWGAGTADGPDPAGGLPDLSRRHLLAALAGTALAAGAAGAVVAGAPDGPAGGRATPSRGRGAATSFGSVAVVGALRAPRPDDGGHLHGDGQAPSGALLDSTWSDTVRADVEVHNGLDRAVLMSPGQFRLRVGRDGPTVSPYAVGSVAGPVAPGATVTTWVTYLAPAGATALSLEYTDTGRPGVLRLALPLAGPAGAGRQR
jgi:hypothetical protein